MIIQDSEAFLEFLKKFFDTKEKKKVMNQEGTNIAHGEAIVAGHCIMLGFSEKSPEEPSRLSISVPHVDEIYKKGLEAGGISIMEPISPLFTGGRFAIFKDPFGNTWWVVSPQPDATENLNPYISPKDCGAFIEFLKKVFNVEEKMKNLTPEGLVSFCDLRVLGTTLQCCEGSQEKRYITGAISVRVQSVDKIYHKAISAGVASVSEPRDSPAGRGCTFKDNFGNFWIINEDEEVLGKKQEVQALKEDQGLCPNLILKEAVEFLEFLKNIFDAEKVTKNFLGDGKTIVHAEFKVSGSTIKCSEGSEQFRYRNGGVFVYVPDADETHKRALAEGATEINPPSDGRSSRVKDFFGNTFWIISAPQKVGI